MFRLLGYFGGIILFLVLGIEKVPGFQYFFACSILNIIVLLLVIIFRGLAKYLHGFWRIWCKRLQRWISSALMCLGHHTELPQYETTTITVDAYGHANVSKTTTNNTLIWGLVEMIICVSLTAVAPLVVAFLLFCYSESIYYECQFQKNTKEKNMQKQEQIARCSARMSLQISLKDSNLPQNNISSFRNSLISAYPYMEPAIVKKSERVSITQALQQKNVEQRILNNIDDKKQTKFLSLLLKQEGDNKGQYSKYAEQKIQREMNNSTYSQKNQISLETKMQTKNESVEINPTNIQYEIGGVYNDQL